MKPRQQIRSYGFQKAFHQIHPLLVFLVKIIQYKKRQFKVHHPSFGQIYSAQPVKIDLNKKSLPKQKTIQNFTIDAQGFRKRKNENPSTRKMGVAS